MGELALTITHNSSLLFGQSQRDCTVQARVASPPSFPWSGPGAAKLWTAPASPTRRRFGTDGRGRKQRRVGLATGVQDLCITHKSVVVLRRAKGRSPYQTWWANGPGRSPTEGLGLKARSIRIGISVEVLSRAFSPALIFADGSWAVGPGWYDPRRWRFGAGQWDLWVMERSKTLARGSCSRCAILESWRLIWDYASETCPAPTGLHPYPLPMWMEPTANRFNPVGVDGIIGRTPGLARAAQRRAE
jgi:hypothetical protein